MYRYNGLTPSGMGSPSDFSFGMPATPGPAPAANPASYSAPAASPAMTMGMDPAAVNAWRQTQFDNWTSKGTLGKTFTNMDGSLNFGNIGSVVQGIGALGSLWAGIQANKTAKDALNFQKDAYKTNLANQISSYNMALEDRAHARAAQTGQSAEDRDRYISKHRLGS